VVGQGLFEIFRRRRVHEPHVCLVAQDFERGVYRAVVGGPG